MDRGGDGDSSDEEAAALLEYEGGISTSEEEGWVIVRET